MERRTHETSVVDDARGRGAWRGVGRCDCVGVVAREQRVDLIQQTTWQWGGVGFHQHRLDELHVPAEGIDGS